MSEPACAERYAEGSCHHSPDGQGSYTQSKTESHDQAQRGVFSSEAPHTSCEHRHRWDQGLVEPPSDLFRLESRVCDSPCGGSRITNVQRS
jgi:hypothetical protein